MFLFIVGVILYILIYTAVIYFIEFPAFINSINRRRNLGDVWYDIAYFLFSPLTIPMAILFYLFTIFVKALSSPARLAQYPVGAVVLMGVGIFDYIYSKLNYLRLWWLDMGKTFMRIATALFDQNHNSEPSR